MQSGYVLFLLCFNIKFNKRSYDVFPDKTGTAI